MTLYRQLILSIFVLFIVTFLGTAAISTNNLRQFLDNQLDAHAQDTATSLGLSLSKPMQNDDFPVVASMVDAIFDRGYYQSISLTTTDGNTLIARSNSASHSDVPEWFRDLINLQVPAAEALVMTGWKQAATVEVISHPGYAYRELWVTALDTFWLFFATAALVLILGFLAIRQLLKPLHRVETQADAICERSYTVQNTLPRTRELRRVVEAMNRLSTTINASFKAQSILTEQLREHAYSDPLTGLGNRRYFDRLLHNFLESAETPTRGAVVLLELCHLEQVNKKSGYLGGDQVLMRTGELIKARLENYIPSQACRISGAGFGIVAADMCNEDADELASMLSKDILQLHIDNLVDHTNIANLGFAMWKPGDTINGVLSNADFALRSAQSLGENTWFRHEPPASEQFILQGAGQWRDYLGRIIQGEEITLHIQPVFSCSGQELLHQEILLRIADQNGRFMTAGVFMPMAERLGLAMDFDKLVIDRFLKHLKSSKQDNSIYAINLNAGSLHDPVFMEWLCNRLGKHCDCAPRMVFEFTEHGVLRDLRTARDVIKQLTGIGCGCGIDHFGHGFGSFGYLSSIKVQYLKIDGSYIRNIDTESDNRFFIHALTDTAHSIGIKVIAESIETAEELDVIKTLNIDGIQGYLTGKPESL